MSICYRQCPTARIEPPSLNKAAETFVTHTNEFTCYCRTLPSLVLFRCSCVDIDQLKETKKKETRKLRINRSGTTKASLVGSPERCRLVTLDGGAYEYTYSFGACTRLVIPGPPKLARPTMGSRRAPFLATSDTIEAPFRVFGSDGAATGKARTECER